MKSKYLLKKSTDNLELNLFFETFVLLAIFNKTTMTTNELAILADSSAIFARSKIRFLRDQSLIQKTTKKELSDCGGRKLNVWRISSEGKKHLNKSHSFLNKHELKYLKNLFLELHSMDKPLKTLTIAVIEAIHFGINTTTLIANHISSNTTYGSTISAVLNKNPTLFIKSNQPSYANSSAYAITPKAESLYFSVIPKE